MNQKEILRQIRKVKEEIRTTPYHKGTEHHIGLLRAKLARLRDLLLFQPRKTRGGTGFMIKKSGDASCLLIGPPSVGKSSLLNRLTNAQSRVGDYDFTTLGVVPGMMFYKGARIQILDAPGIIKEGFSSQGEGRKILSIARAADLILVIVDIERINQIREILDQLNQVGIRVNQSPPKVRVEKTGKGGIVIIDNFYNFDREIIKKIAVEFGLKNGRIIIGEKLKNIDQLIDALSSNRVYLPALFLVNKIDKINKTQRRDLFLQLKNKYYPLFLISAQQEIGLTKLINGIWLNLKLMRIFLKKEKNKPADFKKPLILKKGSKIADVAREIFGDDRIKGALVWGVRVKFPGQRVNLDYPLSDKDEVFLIR